MNSPSELHSSAEFRHHTIPSRMRSDARAFRRAYFPKSATSPTYLFCISKRFCSILKEHPKADVPRPLRAHFKSRHPFKPPFDDVFRWNFVANGDRDPVELIHDFDQ